ncbi:MAG: phosphate/phosphite/phosphonate ABC transporter substrate-binding protein [Methylobacter sp.]|jgi:phosphonate transport system substrate-binding protein|nr:phosphate/phosphite/phosphonate ABC transporter substrate-binding protein [Methylobacter sp.]
MFNIIQSGMKWALFTITLLLNVYAKAEESTYQPTYSPKPPSIIEYVVGIHPLHNPQKLMAVYGPIIDYMNSNIPEAHFKLEASRNYEEFEKKLYTGRFAFAMPNPYQTIQSLKHGYRIFGKMGDDDVFRGIILVRKDSGIQEVGDLKGKAVSYPAATALAATMMPQYYLHTHGIDINRDIENRYVGSQESSIMNVLRGRVAAGATWPVPWKKFSIEYPDMANQLVVKWETEPLLNNGWVVQNEIPLPIADKFARLLFGLHESEYGKLMLEQLPISRFEPATDETYRPVRDFLEKFSKTVRQIE